MTIGQDITPGIVTEIESLPAVDVGSVSDSNVMLVGQGDISDGSAEPNQPYTITRSSNVREHFGTDNMISGAVSDALEEGALPVYAVVTDEEEVTEEIDATAGSLENVPISEDPDDITFTDGGTEYEVNVVINSVNEYDVGEEEVYINPVYGEYSLNNTPDSGTFEYTAYDYQSAFDAVQDEAADQIDYVYSLNENEDVQDMLEGCLEEMKSFHQFAIGGVGASPFYTEDEKNDYEARFDNSRMQVFYPSRNEAGETIMGAIGGMKARQGINGTTMNKRLQTHNRLIDRIDFGDEETFINATTVPVQSSTRGALLVDDPTCVDPETSPEESQMTDGYSRFVVDQVAEVTHDNEEPYIGKLNKPSARGALQASIDSGIEFLEEQDAVLNYSVRVYKRDAMSAIVDLSVETVKPLRNIYNNISVGEDSN